MYRLCTLVTGRADRELRLTAMAQHDESIILYHTLYHTAYIYTLYAVPTKCIFLLQHYKIEKIVKSNHYN